MNAVEDTVRITDKPFADGPSTAGSRAFATETPIFAAMIAAWDGPAADIVAHRAGPGGGDGGGGRDGYPAAAQVALPARNAEAPALRQLLSVGLEADGQDPVITATGELNVATAGLLADPVRRVLLGHPREVIVDLSGVAALSAAGLGALLELRRAAAAAGTRFTLRAPSPPVRDLLEVTGAGAEFVADLR